MRRVFVGVIALAVLAVVALGVSRIAPAQPKVTEVLIGSVEEIWLQWVAILSDDRQPRSRG